MNKNVLQEEIQQYIDANLNADLHFLMLKNSPFPGVSMQEIVQQIKGKNIAKKKFTFLLHDGVYFPPNLNLEQASSEATANYKANLVGGKSFLDLTSGFAIDAYFLSQKFQQTTLVEQNEELLQIVQHNWNVLGRKATLLNRDLHHFLETNNQTFDLIYLDPARRDEKQNKVFLLEDLSPNFLEIADQLVLIGQIILMKLSPLIDIRYLFSVLKNRGELHIVAVKNEVKEILVHLDRDSSATDQKVVCVNLQTDEPNFEFSFEDESEAFSSYSEPLKYIYIPNNALLKSGAFNQISKHFQLKKFHPNTHLYTSDERIQDFPGRILEMESIQAKTLKKGEQYNIISKNHPLKPAEIKSRYQLRDGGEQYLIFTQTLKGKIILKSI